MDNNNTDEIDLGFVFSKIKKSITNLLISLINGVNFIRDHWWKILIVAFIGAGLGYYVKNNRESNKETTLLIQNNFNSSSYVYNAVEQLNSKIWQNDTVFLKELGLYDNEKIILNIEIEPIVNLMALVNRSNERDKSLDLFLQEADFVDELLTSEVFTPQYKFHKIYITTSSKAENEITEKILSFLNNSVIFNKIKEVKIEEAQFRLKSYERTIKDIDNILEAIPKQAQEEKLNGSQVYVSTGNTYTDLDKLVASKSQLLTRREDLKQELLKFNNIVTIMNNPVLVASKELVKNKITGFAILFVFGYLLLFFLRNMYLNLKNHIKNQGL